MELEVLVGVGCGRKRQRVCLRCGVLVVLVASKALAGQALRHQRAEKATDAKRSSSKDRVKNAWNQPSVRNPTYGWLPILLDVEKDLSGLHRGLRESRD